MEPVEEPRERLGPALALCAAAALLMDLGGLHRAHNGDTLVPVLVSLQRWTPFYWGAGRYGMLIPLLAKPFANPFTNLLVQCGLSAFFGWAALFLTARYAAKELHWATGASLAGAVFLFVTPEGFRFDWFVSQQYATALTLAMAALLAMEGVGAPLSGWRRGLAVGLMALASWVNFLVVLPLLPLVVLRHFLGWARERTRASFSLAWRAAAPGVKLLVWGVVAGRLEIWLAGARPDVVGAGVIPLSTWPQALSTFGAACLAVVSGWGGALGPLLVLAALVGTLGALWARAGRPERSWAPLAPITALVGAAFLYGCASAVSGWVKMNSYAARYVLPSFLFVAVACSALCVAGAAVLLPAKWMRVARHLSAALLLIAVGRAYGPPSVRAIRSSLDSRFGGMTEDILSRKIHLIAGDYWAVWPAVFHANLTQYERGEPPSVYGLSDRGRATYATWRSMPGPLSWVAAPRGDASALKYLKDAALCACSKGEASTVDLLELCPCSS